MPIDDLHEQGSAGEDAVAEDVEFRFDDPRQRRIYEGLVDLVGPGPAAFFRDACVLVSAGNHLLTSAHLVGHLLRELEAALREVLTETVASADEVEPVSEEDRPSSSASPSPEKRPSHKDQIRAILRALAIPEEHPIAEAWLKAPGTKSTPPLHARAHRKALGDPRQLDDEFRQFWEDFQAVLDAVLERFEARYLEVFRVLDDLLGKAAPTGTDADILRQRVPQNQVAYEYFFGRLSSVGWLRPLIARGFFDHPPGLEQVGDRITMPRWPQSAYLARIAADAPADVREVITRTETENILVHNDFLDAALAMPVEHAAEVGTAAIQWLGSRFAPIDPEKYARLANYLTEGGEITSATELMSALLRLESPPSPTDESAASYLSSIELRARADEWHYKRLLTEQVPQFVATTGEDGLRLLCRTLAAGVGLARPAGEENEIGSNEDHSISWLQYIDGGNPHHEGFLASLARAVRDSAAKLLEHDSDALPHIVGILSRYHWKVFERLSLDLIRRFGGPASELVRDRLLDHSRWADASLSREYQTLLHERYGELSKGDREVILAWIEGGPNLDRYREWRKEWDGSPPPEDQVEAFARKWRRRHLAPIAEHIPEEWARRYQGLVEDLSFDPRAPDDEGGWIGPTSPITIEDLREMSVGAVIEYLRAWRASSEWRGPTPEGLGSLLGQVVAGDPTRFAEHAPEFADLDPTYVRGLVSGLRDAINGERAFAWAPVLRLCGAVMAKAREIPGRSGDSREADADWGWTRKAIADLLQRGLQAGPTEIDLAQRELVWQVLEPLTCDPEPTPEYEEKYGGSNMSPVNLSINTVRGEAMHAVVQYALWIRRALERQDEAEARIEAGFGLMPEVAQALEAHLAPDADPSLAVRSVYGQKLPWLILLDPIWVTAHLRLIFPEEERLAEYWTTAWESYINRCRPYDNVLPVIDFEYQKAVRGLGGSGSTPIEDHGRHLAEHLATFFWRGLLPLDGNAGILSEFYRAAPDILRAHVMKYIGRSLKNTEGAVPTEILERLRELWAARLEAGRVAPEEHREELAAFGWWFASGKFEIGWSLRQLRLVLELTGSSGPDHLILERLASVAPACPEDAVECLAPMVHKRQDYWRIRGWAKEMRTILRQALGSGQAGARSIAVSVINRLAARGHVDFRDLLREQAPDHQKEESDGSDP